MAQSSRILVVDDDATARGAVVEALRGAGYVTAACGAMAAALRTAASFRPDLIVLEMVLGGRAVGADLGRRLFADANPLLLFVTREPSAVDRLAAFEAGADDYVVKPIAPEELLARVHALLRRGGRLSSAVVEVGGLVIDERTHRVAFGGTDLHLTPIDFSLLAVLARHAGQVLSKARLLDAVWGYDIVDVGVVEVHISTMRHALGPEAAALVHTIRGVGYTLRDETNP